MIGRAISCKYTGPLGDWSGYGSANRNAVLALHRAGVEVTVQKKSYTNKEAEYGKNYDAVKELVNRNIPYDIKIVHIPPDGYLQFLEPGKYHIGHLFWETDGLSREWVWNCNLMDEIWTGGEVHKENFQKAGVKVPIHVFPQAIDTDVNVKPFHIKGRQGFLFYSVFEWIERKNPRALLQAYYDEFQGVEDVTLLLKVYKVSSAGNASSEIRKDIAEWKATSGHRSFPNMLLCHELLSSNDMMRLHEAGDCFVSAHRGEGWGVPQAEAAVVGKPIISTNLGGIHEWFTDGKDALLTNWKPVNVFNMEFAPWYETDQMWAEVDQGDLRGKMRWVYDNQAKAKHLGREARKMVRDRFSFKVVGDMMKHRLEEIQKEVGQ